MLRYARRKIANLTTTSDIFGISAGLGSTFITTTVVGNEIGNATISKNILNAINWTAQAWNSVTDDTVYHHWQRTGILPNEDEEMHEEPNELENELESELES